jgi:hypothetical protein
MQRVPPRYRRATELELEDLGDDAEWMKEHGKRTSKPRRRRQAPTAVELVFDVSRWRLPSRWRNDKRVGDVAMSKMLRGVDPRRTEALANTGDPTPYDPWADYSNPLHPYRSREVDRI